jgi:hypothetical protein
MHHCLGSASLLNCISIAVCAWDRDALEYDNVAYTNVRRRASDKKKMKRLIRLLILLTIWTSAYGQINADTSYGMTVEQNKDWLKKVGNADKDLQLSLVKGRLIENRQTLNPVDKLDVPVLIIDGIPITDNISGRQREFLKTQLTAETVYITLVEKEPEGRYVNKGFTGIILIVITDKKKSKKFRRLK